MRRHWDVKHGNLLCDHLLLSYLDVLLSITRTTGLRYGTSMVCTIRNCHWHHHLLRHLGHGREPVGDDVVDTCTLAPRSVHRRPHALRLGLLLLERVLLLVLQRGARAGACAAERWNILRCSALISFSGCVGLHLMNKLSPFTSLRFSRRMFPLSVSSPFIACHLPVIWIPFFLIATGSDCQCQHAPRTIKCRR